MVVLAGKPPCTPTVTPAPQVVRRSAGMISPRAIDVTTQEARRTRKERRIRGVSGLAADRTNYSFQEVNSLVARITIIGHEVLRQDKSTSAYHLLSIETPIFR